MLVHTDDKIVDVVKENIFAEMALSMMSMNSAMTVIKSLVIDVLIRVRLKYLW